MALTYLCLFSLLAFSQAALLKFDPRIVNGEDAKNDEIPYLVSLQLLNNSHFCGGSILNRNYVITTAHCIEDKYAVLIKVIAGTVNLDSPRSNHLVERIIMHRGYEPSDSWIHDIALLKVSTPFRFNKYIQPVSLPTTDLTVKGDAAITSGWGRLWQDGPTSKQLQKVKIYIADQDYCFNKYIIRGYNIYPTQICAYEPRIEKGPCHGDAGGPLIVKGYLVGLTSWSESCASIYFPAVYTRVAKYINWINANMI